MVTATDLKTADQEEKLEWTNGEVTLIYSEEAGTQIIQHQESLMDYCSISSSCSLEPPGFDSSSAADSSSLATNSGTLCPPLPLPPANQERLGSNQDQQASISPDPVDTEVTANPTVPELQAFKVLTVEGTLWIPRYNILNITYRHCYSRSLI